VIDTLESTNKAIVREAFDTLFNKRDYAKAMEFWSPDYIQHSAHIAPGRNGLFDLIRGLPDTFKYEPELIMTDGEWVLLRGRFSGMGLPSAWIACDTVRMENGKIKEHWDVIEDEVTRENSLSGLPMFGDKFPDG
jgi:predicted SnoaL-like aldol condensation-catalyzing enzyme